MFATQKNPLKGLTSKQYTVMQDLCRYAKNLYNVALYNLRQHFIVTGKLLSYADNCATARKKPVVRHEKKAIKSKAAA
jgi:hypothetical protein